MNGDFKRRKDECVNFLLVIRYGFWIVFIMILRFKYFQSDFEELFQLILGNKWKLIFLNFKQVLLEISNR